jgi:hypothetical protein
MKFSLADLALLVTGSTPDEDQVTPGVIGFVAIFFLAAATILLVLDMVRRVRRTRYRGEVREQLERERVEREQSPATGDSAVGEPTDRV